METAGRIIRAARQWGVSFLTLYTFSLVSWERPREEVDELMRLVEAFASQLREPCLELGIGVRTIGDVDELRTNARRAVDELVAATVEEAEMTLTLAVSYGAQDDIARAARAIAVRARAGLLIPEEIDVDSFHREMSTHDLPPVDLFIRTGGEATLGDFLLYESARAQVHFSSLLWPDFGQDELRHALEEHMLFRQTRTQIPPREGFDPA
jgi:undecaprenyl diphosphate synthase